MRNFTPEELDDYPVDDIEEAEDDQMHRHLRHIKEETALRRALREVALTDAVGKEYPQPCPS